MMINFKSYPWKRTKMSPSFVGLEAVCNYIEGLGKESMLEIGAGASTWYLHQLGFKTYTAVETFPAVVERFNSLNLKNFTLVQKWEDIPVLKYQWVFIDSHVGGNALGNQREKPLIYAIENKLLKDPVIIFFHDYRGIKLTNEGKNPHKWARAHDGWNNTVRDYKLRLVETLNKDEFGVYKMGDK